jgi:hypothetical protein
MRLEEHHSNFEQENIDSFPEDPELTLIFQSTMKLPTDKLWSQSIRVMDIQNMTQEDILTGISDHFPIFENYFSLI